MLITRTLIALLCSKISLSVLKHTQRAAIRIITYLRLCKHFLLETTSKMQTAAGKVHIFAFKFHLRILLYCKSYRDHVDESGLARILETN